MAYITPDIPFSGPSVPNPEVNPDELLRMLLERFAQQGQPNVQPGQEDILRALAGQNMVQGLTNELPQGRAGLNFQQSGMGAQGYAGPLRQSDIPLQRSYATMPPEQAAAADEEARIRAQQIPGVGPAGNLADLQAVISKLPKEVQAAIAKSAYPQLKIQDPLEARIAMAQLQDQLIRGRQATQEANKPLPPAVQANLNYMNDIRTRLESLGTAIDQGLHEQYAGPIAGRTYSTRRMIPGATQESEVGFFQDIADLKDLLLRKRSGAQINEREAQRLAALLPKETDDPTTFKQAYDKFATQFDKSIAQNKLLAVTTRGELKKQIEGGSSSVQPTMQGLKQLPPATSVPAGAVATDRATGKKYRNDGKQWIAQ